MRRTFAVTVSLVALAGLTPAPTPEVHQVTIVGACTSETPQVIPERITVNRGDSVVWRDPSRQAEGFTVEPKEAGAWPFALASHAASRGEPAESGILGERTLGGQPVQTGQVYPYQVTIDCPGGGMRVVDPDIVIGAF